jgi:hypothetical protein
MSLSPEQRQELIRLLEAGGGNFSRPKWMGTFVQKLQNGLR